jgi:hypothetical protein
LNGRSSRCRAAAAGLLLSVASVVALSSCSLPNQGGETTCNDFIRMDLEQQITVVEKMLVDAGQPTTEAQTYRQSALAMCSFMGDPDAPIKRVFTG